MKRVVVVVFIALLMSCDSKEIDIVEESKTEVFNAKEVQKSNKTALWMHYMPWFEDDKSSDDGKWGSHWTMANKNPNIIKDGKREIAAHFYPLIGPYSSSNKKVLEYHFLLMKYAGIDGVLIDWYGTRDYYDYDANRKNSEVIIEVIESVGLNFAIVYEDQTLRDGIDDIYEKQQQAIKDLLYLERKFLKKETYIKIDGKPLLLTFGPQVINTPLEWTNIFSRINTTPAFITLFAHSNKSNDNENMNSVGEFIWVDKTDMQQKYDHVKNFELFIGAAYPGFKDYYKEGGWGNNILLKEHDGGNTLRETLNLAKENNSEFIQLITWNDFGEGTMIEPTDEFQFLFLEIIQEFSGVKYGVEELQTIYEYYNLLEKNSLNQQNKELLKQVYYYLISLQIENAKETIRTISE